MENKNNDQWTLEKTEILEKPPVSEAQRKAMWAAASGHSDVGIPKSVGEEFADADTGGKLPEKVKKDEASAIKAKLGDKPQPSFEDQIAEIKQRFRDKKAKGVNLRQQIKDMKSKYKDSLTKGNYGPKDMKLYDPVNNIKRKENRVGEEVPGAGPNVAVHAVAGVQGSAKQQAAREAKALKAKNKLQPVKVFTDEEKAAYQAKLNQDVNKSAIPSHIILPGPTTIKLQPTSEEFMNAVAAMFPHLPRTQEDLAKMGATETNPIADFYAEAQKPVDQSKTGGPVDPEVEES